MTIQVHQFPCLADNYGFLVHSDATGETWCIDTPDADAILRELAATGWQLTGILNTHHHSDHVGGNEAVKEATGCRIFGPVQHASRIPGLDEAVDEGRIIGLPQDPVQVLAIPGHTRGHVAYWFENARSIFVGDTLFPLGCGRLFGGTAEQLCRSLARIAALPEDTLIYSAHEYTLDNLRFALSIDPSNQSLARRAIELRSLRQQSMPTVPTTVLAERETNPFVRAHTPEVAAATGNPGADAVSVFAWLRQAKDDFADDKG